MVSQEYDALGIRAQKHKKQVSQTWERLIKQIMTLPYTEKVLKIKLLWRRFWIKIEDKLYVAHKKYS